LLLPWLLGGGGMGDVKLLAALGVWLGPILLLVIFGAAAVLAAFAAVAIMAASAAADGFSLTRQRYAQTASTGNSTVGTPPQPRKGRRVLPFAVPVAVSTWLVLAWMLLQRQGL
jgi:prepilin peptidase CpaA